MTQRFQWFLVVTLLVSVQLVACSAPPRLDRIPGNVPDGLDFSGTWLLNDEQLRVSHFAGGSGVDALIAKKPEPGKDAPGASLFVFLEKGQQVKITQTTAGLFMAFDRAIVEEYRFGELRTVNVGPIVAQRATGFVGRALRIETLGEDRALMRETLRLEGDTLVRDIRITRKERVLYDESRRYRRDRR